MESIADVIVVSSVAGAGLSVPAYADRHATVAGWILATALALVVLFWVVWRRATRHSRVPAVCFAVLALVGSSMTAAVNGLPLAMVGICALSLKFGRRVGVAAGLAFPTGIGVVALLFGLAPGGGLILNLLLISLFLLLGLAAADIARHLDAARRSAEELAAERRRAALADVDRLLADDRMAHARMLHDDLGQRLTIIGVELQLAQRMRAGQETAAWQEIERARELTDAALTALRRQVRALSPATRAEREADDVGVTLDRLSAAFRSTGLAVEVTRTGTEPVDDLAYRVIQEALTNVVRHSSASHVEIAITTGPRTVVSVVDNGDSDARAAGEGFGLRHLRDRVETAGGTFTAARHADGFRVQASYPVLGAAS